MSARSLLVACALVVCALSVAALSGAWRLVLVQAPSDVDSADASETRPSADSGQLDLHDPGQGQPAFVTPVSTEVHGGHRQSWDAVQMPNGLLYVANTHGVLEHDGISWRLIPTELGLIRTVALDAAGRLLAGGEEGVGAFVPDSLGTLRAETLVSPDSLGGEAVWGVFTVGGRTVLQTFSQLVLLDGDRIASRVVAPEGQRFHKAFDVAGRLIVRLEGEGLMEYRDAALRAIPGGETFADQPVRAMFDLDGAPGGALLAVTDDALFRLGGGAPMPLVSAVTDVLRDGRAYHGCRLGDGPRAAFAITTLGQGVLVLDGTGQIVQHFGAEVGLTSDEMVLGCTVDAQGGLWLALSDGLLRVDAAAPLSTFRTAEGLPGALYDIVRHEGWLYAGTERGVFRQTRPSSGQPVRFERVAPEQSLNQAWSLAPTAAGLLVASTDGVYVVEGLSADRVMDGPAYTLAERANGDWLVGLKGGVRTLSSTDGWHDAGRVVEADAEVRVITQAGGFVWAMEREGRLLRIEGDRVEAFGAEEGVPADIVTVDAEGDRLTLLSRDAVYDADPVALGRGGRVTLNRPLTTMARRVAGGEGEAAYYSYNRDTAGRVWLSGREGTVVLERRGSAWAEVTPLPFRRLANVLPVHLEGDVTFVGTSEGLYRLVGDGARYDVAGQALVRTLTAEDDGTLFGGAALGRGLEAPYGQALRFGFALPAFNDADGTQYRSVLDGFDRRPSDWSSDAQRDYTNLPPGDYTFRVEARTAQGARAKPAELAFTIPPPWYLSRWAFGGYVVLVALFIGGIVTLSSRHERRKAAAAAARAAELAELNEQLREADRLKDDMLANTSHELRTPLTAIIGFSEILQEYGGGDAAEVRELASHMFSGGRRLLRTVNDLLDIAQLRAGKLHLDPRDVDAAAVVRAVAAELRPLADEKGLAFSVHPAALVVPACLDADALARVLINLVSNAIKFTDHGGVAVFVDGDAEAGELTLAVQDSGIGIAPEFIPHLFDEYVQESTGHARRAEGNGLGLAITRRVVGLMGGRIEVVSEPGRGTRVTVRLPLRSNTLPHVHGAAADVPAGPSDEDAAQGASLAVDQLPPERR